MNNIVILISGGGSNMQALVQAAHKRNWQGRFGAKIAAIISNKATAGGLQLAAAAGVPTQVLDHAAYKKQVDPRAAFDEALADAIAQYDPKLVLLAGFMRILGPSFVQRFEGKLLNIHPSLLPAFAGLNTHQRAIDAGCQVAGATVHAVTAELDCGPILAQATVPVLPNDTAQTLAARVLSQEHLIYPQAVEEFMALNFKIDS